MIYLDQAFALNGLLDYLLLVVCGSITATPLRRGRIALAAGVGGLYAVLSLTEPLRFLGLPWFQLMLALALCLLAFGGGRGLLRRTVVLLLLAAAFCGLVMVLTGLFSAPAAMVGSRVYYPLSFGVLALTGGGAFSLMKWGLSRLRHQGGDVASAAAELRGRRVNFTALRDTGNTLTDPMTGCPVLVCDPALFRRLFPEHSADELKQPAELARSLSDAGFRPRLIPYRAVGVERGLLLGIKPESLLIDGRPASMLLAFSPGMVSDGGGYQALLGGKL